MDAYKITLSEGEMPQAWYNIQPDLPRPLPPYLHPATGEPETSGSLGMAISEAVEAKVAASILKTLLIIRN